MSIESTSLNIPFVREYFTFELNLKVNRIYFELYSRSDKVTIYSIRFEGCPVKETDHFLDEYFEKGFLEDIRLIKRWLSHNFTIKTLALLEVKLGVSIFQVSSGAIQPLKKAMEQPVNVMA